MAKRKRTRGAPPDVPQRIRRTDKRASAIDLRRAGWDYWEIADALALTDISEARALVKEAMAEVEKDLKETASELLGLQLARCEQLIKALLPKALAPENEHQARGQARAVEMVLKVMEQQAKLEGLYAPEKKEVNVNFRLEDLSDEELVEEARRLGVQVTVLGITNDSATPLLPAPDSYVLPGDTCLPDTLPQPGGTSATAEQNTRPGGSPERNQCQPLPELPDDRLPPAPPTVP